MRKPLAIDLCCGKGGWTNGLIAAGYDVIGFDVVKFVEYRGHLVVQDVQTLVGKQFRRASLIVASSPCQEFSSITRLFHPGRTPALGIDLFRACARIGKESGVPYILENVGGAVRYLGPAVNHCGPFYFWGNAVPAVFPPEAYRVRKGFSEHTMTAGHNRGWQEVPSAKRGRRKSL